MKFSIAKINGETIIRMSLLMENQAIRLKEGEIFDGKIDIRLLPSYNDGESDLKCVGLTAYIISSNGEKYQIINCPIIIMEGPSK